MEQIIHTALRNTIRDGAFSRDQLIDLWDAISTRVCQIEAPELEGAIQEISDADETLKEALVKLEERESRFAPPDECTLAKQETEAAL